ncbi:MAG: nicotinamide mononucleotide transporter [Bacteroidales bacterium]|nr:nicotinamide mononucleotide transporter [Candidatus Cacconaster equifaecalis]
MFDIIAAILGLVCVFLAGRGSKYNFYVGYLYSAALFLLFWERNLLASLMLQPVSLVINAVGHYRWTHPREGEASSEKAGELKVTTLSTAGRVVAVATVFVVAAVWGMLLDRLFPADPHPYLDSCLTILILVAQTLSALKKWDCWVAWLFVNIVQLALHLSVGNVCMSVVSALYLANSIVSIRQWIAKYRRNA